MLLVQLLHLLLVLAAQVVIHTLALVVLSRVYEPEGTSLFLLGDEMPRVLHAGAIARDGTCEVILEILLCLGSSLLLLFYFLSEHAFESAQNFLLILLAEHVGKLCDLSALF